MEKIIAKSKAMKINNSNDSLTKKEFLKLPPSERSKILKKQAECMLEHYKNDNEWKEFQSLDIHEY